MPMDERPEPRQSEKTTPPAGLTIPEPRIEAFRCGPWRVDPSLNRLERGDDSRRVGSTAMDLLLHLVRLQGRLAAKEDLVREVWGGRAVSDDALSVCVHELRKVLGDDARSPTYIETIPGKGYRWLPEVEWQRPDLSAPPPSTESPHTPAPRKRPGARLRTGFAAAAFFVLATVLTARWLAVDADGVSDAVKSDAVQKDAVKTVAVLPLSDFSAGALGDRVFADGLTEALTHALASHGPLRVISRTSTTRFIPPTDLSAPQIAAQLGADLLVEGSVTREAHRVRVTAQLIDGIDDRHLWAGTYDAELGELLALQARVAGEIAREIRLHTGGLELASALEMDRLSTRGPRSYPTAAIDAYFQGRAELYAGYFGAGGLAALRTARQAFEHAIRIAPDFAEAHCGLAKTQIALYWQFRRADRAEVARGAGEAIARALELDPKLAMAHAVQADYLIIFERDLEAAERSFRLALGLAPSQLETYLSRSWMLQAQRRFEEAEVMLEQARRVDPLSPLPLQALAALAYNRGDDERALAFADRLDEVLPGSARLLRAAALNNLSRPDAAYRAYRRHLEASGGDLDLLRQLDESFEGGGLDGYLRASLPFIRDPTSRAVLFMRLGDRDAALDALTRAAAEDDPKTFLAFASPTLVPLHDEPRFRDVLRHYGVLVEEQRVEEQRVEEERVEEDRVDELGTGLARSAGP